MRAVSEMVPLLAALVAVAAARAPRMVVVRRMVVVGVVGLWGFRVLYCTAEVVVCCGELRYQGEVFKLMLELNALRGDWGVARPYM